MDSQSQYSQPYQTASAQRYPSTSSAFSASANPNEDWTKITDLAERRRIQNRIAQRNYRKKLKKRLEDLEKRAASSSASPEQKPAELESVRPQKRAGQSSVRNDSRNYSFDSQSSQGAPVSFAQFDDGAMFSEQYTRQLSTSPPPLIYSGYSSDAMGYPPYSQDLSYPSLTTADMPIFPAELPPLSSSLQTSISAMAPDYPIKQEPYMHSDMPSFSMGYSAMAGIDISAAQTYSDSGASLSTTPPLSDCFEHSIAGSPPDLSMPTTPPYLGSL